MIIGRSFKVKINGNIGNAAVASSLAEIADPHGIRHILWVRSML
jgi:thiamine biosynthesis protein ThiC